jgi:hypothetical protein
MQANILTLVSTDVLHEFSFFPVWEKKYLDANPGSRRKNVKVKKIKYTLQQATKAQRGSRCIPLIFL